MLIANLLSLLHRKSTSESESTPPSSTIPWAGRSLGAMVSGVPAPKTDRRTSKPRRLQSPKPMREQAARQKEQEKGLDDALSDLKGKKADGRELKINEGRPIPGEPAPAAWCSANHPGRYGVMVPGQGTMLAHSEAEVKALFQGHFDRYFDIDELRDVAVGHGAILLATIPGKGVFPNRLAVWPSSTEEGKYSVQIPGQGMKRVDSLTEVDALLTQAKCPPEFKPAPSKERLKESLSELVDAGLKIRDDRPAPSSDHPSVWFSKTHPGSFGVMVPGRGTLLARSEEEVTLVFQGHFLQQELEAKLEAMRGDDDTPKEMMEQAEAMGKAARLGMGHGAILSPTPPGKLFQDRLVVWPSPTAVGKFGVRIPGRGDLRVDNVDDLESLLDEAKAPSAFTSPMQGLANRYSATAHSVRPSRLDRDQRAIWPDPERPGEFWVRLPYQANGTHAPDIDDAETLLKMSNIRGLPKMANKYGATFHASDPGRDFEGIAIWSRDAFPGKLFVRIPGQSAHEQVPDGSIDRELKTLLKAARPESSRPPSSLLTVEDETPETESLRLRSSPSLRDLSGMREVALKYSAMSYFSDPGSRTRGPAIWPGSGTNSFWIRLPGEETDRIALSLDEADSILKGARASAPTRGPTDIAIAQIRASSELAEWEKNGSLGVLRERPEDHVHGPAIWPDDDGKFAARIPDLLDDSVTWRAMSLDEAQEKLRSYCATEDPEASKKRGPATSLLSPTVQMAAPLRSPSLHTAEQIGEMKEMADIYSAKYHDSRPAQLPPGTFACWPSPTKDKFLCIRFPDDTDKMANDSGDARRKLKDGADLVRKRQDEADLQKVVGQMRGSLSKWEGHGLEIRSRAPADNPEEDPPPATIWPDKFGSFRVQLNGEDQPKFAIDLESAEKILATHFGSAQIDGGGVAAQSKGSRPSPLPSRSLSSPIARRPTTAEIEDMKAFAGTVDARFLDSPPRPSSGIDYRDEEVEEDEADDKLAVWRNQDVRGGYQVKIPGRDSEFAASAEDAKGLLARGQEDIKKRADREMGINFEKLTQSAEMSGWRNDKGLNILPRPPGPDNVSKLAAWPTRDGWFGVRVPGKSDETVPDLEDVENRIRQHLAPKA
jgi:hypothetical protein